MAIKTYKPTTPSRRHMTVSAFEGIDKKAKPERSLTENLKKNAGRNSYGRITVLPRLPLLSPPLLPLLFLGDLPALFFEKSEHGPNPPLSADLYFPVEPKPPAPRWVSSSWSTIFTWAWTTGTTISWAMRSAGWMT